MLSLYDSLFLPIADAIANRDRKEGCGVLCRNLIALPFVFLATFVSGSGIFVHSAAEVAEDLTDAAMETKLADAIGDKIEEGVNKLDQVTGVDVDGDGDVGLEGDAREKEAPVSSSGRRGSCRRPLPSLHNSGQLPAPVDKPKLPSVSPRLPPLANSPPPPKP